MLKVNLYATLRSIAKQKTVEVDLPDGSSLTQILTYLFERYPQLESQILDEDGEIQEFVSVFISGRDVRYLDYLDSTLVENQNLDIFPPVAGG